MSAVDLIGVSKHYGSTVAANVAFGLKMRGVDRGETAKHVAEALELVAMPGYGERYPSELSGGHQQRVAAASSTPACSLSG